MQWFVGYGSLVDEKSARKTCPNLQNFGYYWLEGYKRIFGIVAYRPVLQDPAILGRKELAACYIVPEENATPMFVCCFQIPENDLAELKRREFEYYEQNVEIRSAADQAVEKQATVFVGYGCDDLRDVGKGSDCVEKNQPDFYALYKGPYYRNDILPSDVYLRQCLDAYKCAGQDAYENFLDTSFLGNGSSLRSYVEMLNAQT